MAALFLLYFRQGNSKTWKPPTESANYSTTSSFVSFPSLIFLLGFQKREWQGLQTEQFFLIISTSQVEGLPREGLDLTTQEENKTRFTWLP